MLLTEAVEIFYILESDMLKDSSNECTILSKALDEAKRALDRKNTALPGSLVIEAWLGRKLAFNAF